MASDNRKSEGVHFQHPCILRSAEVKSKWTWGYVGYTSLLMFPACITVAHIDRSVVPTSFRDRGRLIVTSRWRDLRFIIVYVADNAEVVEAHR